MFINEDIKEQMREDTLNEFRKNNPCTSFKEPLTGMHWLLYSMRWVKYYALPGFIH